MDSLLDLDIDEALKLAEVLSFTNGNPASENSPESLPVTMDAGHYRQAMSPWSVQTATAGTYSENGSTMGQHFQNALKLNERYVPRVEGQNGDVSSPYISQQLYPIDQQRVIYHPRLGYLQPASVGSSHVSWNRDQPEAPEQFSSRFSSPEAVYTTAPRMDAPFYISQHKLDTCYAYALDRGNGQYTPLIPADQLPSLKGLPRLQGAHRLIILPPLSTKAAFAHTEMDADVSHNFHPALSSNRASLIYELHI
jgi:hypothetical protein